MRTNGDKGIVLVTNGEQRAALATVRSLGAAGYTVLVSSTSGRTISGASRYAREEARTADALQEPARFAADIRALIDARGIDTVIPITEGALLALLPVRDDLPGVLIPFPDLITFRRAMDKQFVMSAAQSANIAVPSQCVVQTSGEAAKLDLKSLPFPIVVKPSRSVVGEEGQRVRLSVQHAASAEELGHVLKHIDERAYPLLLQQRVVGPGIGVFLLIWDGETVASFSHRRIREKPPSGGVSVYRESIAMDESLLARSRTLLDQLGWQGVAMIEFKMDSRTGTPYIMEINGRLWGSLQLAVDAGVDFPRLLVEAAAGRHPAAVTEYTAGVRLRWLWGDIDHLIARMRRTNEALAMPPGSPSRWRAVREFFERNPGDRHELLRRDDPRPFLRESLQWFRQLGSD